MKNSSKDSNFKKCILINSFKVGTLSFNIVLSWFFLASKKPRIETCRIGAESDRGEVRNSTSHGECQKEKSTYINFQPKSLSFKFVTAFDTLKGLPEKPIHIHEYHFGIVHAEVSLLMTKEFAP